MACKRDPKQEVISEETESTNISLKQKIGQMVMVGFRGTTAQADTPIHQMITDYNLGGVVLFNKDLPSSGTEQRNITSPKQLKALTSQLQTASPQPLFIAIDEEGGLISRLKPENGFQQHASHQSIGELNDPEKTKQWASNMAKELSDLGINVNFAPVVDVNTNPDNPIIGKLERSFSADVYEVVKHAKIFIEAHQKKGIITVPKHFPGHGSATGDTHKGLVDVSENYDEMEMYPFKHTIKEAGAIMTAHVYNKMMDTVPATLSSTVLEDFLREAFNYEDVIFSDDMQMRAIANFYDFETSIEKAINAGVDVLLFANNASPCAPDAIDCQEIPFNPSLAKDVIEHIYSLVQEGKITEARINYSYENIMRLKGRLR